MTWKSKKRLFSFIKLTILVLFGSAIVACTTSSLPPERLDVAQATLLPTKLESGSSPTALATLAVSTATAVSVTSTPTVPFIPIIQPTVEPTQPTVEPTQPTVEPTQPTVEPTPSKSERPFNPTRISPDLSTENVSRLDIFFREPENKVWLTYLNEVRWQAGLPAVEEDDKISLGAQAHSEYMGRNDNPVSRMELPDNPFYSDEGRIAAYRSNIFFAF